MKKFIVAVLSLLPVALTISAFSACDLFAQKRQKEERSAPTAIEYEMGADYIKITKIFDSFWFNSHEYENEAEYKLHDGEWQSEAEFTSLAPNTEYTVSVRFSENDRFKASDAYSEKITTLKYEQDIPEVSLIQENKTIRFEENTALEFSYDGGNTYSSGNAHTYTENGKYTVKVRYKETEQKYSSAEQIFTVTISDFYSGTGTVDDPYLIKTVDHFVKIDGGSYKLIEDLDFVNTNIAAPKNCSNFDGNGKTIKNVTLKASNHIAIFGNVNNSIKNLNVESAFVDFNGEPTEQIQHYSIAILANYCRNISNCRVSGSINLQDDYENQYRVGGIISHGIVDIFNCSADIKITSHTNSLIYAGGISGYGYSVNQIRNSSANVDFNFTGSFIGYIGGIAGYMTGGSAENCRADGEINVDGDTGNSNDAMYVGGIVGRSMNCKNCVSTVAISANGLKQNVKVGGIIGKLDQYHQIENCLSARMLVVDTDGVKECACDSIAGEADVNAMVVNCFHLEDIALGAATEHSIAVTAETAKTLAWQKEVLGLDESIWSLTDGEYPSLK